ncbi:hypothetical protein JAAARDRAFT_36967 [Jaapia argillacea MUCL 33604]|uniref:Uncharacterized protein n=1 Tax=Jaapia argillacea MUCL 33604 TaxID=933084 RepID=A0A067PQV7_9AGAM|nr:hypothetical protein JAAARDRAFT_36967 [Jaapia argillacea MUCL 33604]
MAHDDANNLSLNSTPCASLKDEPHSNSPLPPSQSQTPNPYPDSLLPTLMAEPVAHRRVIGTQIAYDLPPRAMTPLAIQLYITSPSPIKSHLKSSSSPNSINSSSRPISPTASLQTLLQTNIKAKFFVPRSYLISHSWLKLCPNKCSRDVSKLANAIGSHTPNTIFWRSQGTKIGSSAEEEA